MWKTWWDKLWAFAHTGLGTGIILFILSGVGLKAIVDGAQELGKSTWTYMLENIIFVDITVDGWQLAVWVISPFALLYLYGVWKDNKREIEALTVKALAVEEPVTAVVTTSELENLILEFYKTNYGARASVEQITRIIRVNDLLSVEQAIDNLVRTKHFLHAHYNVLEDTSYTLTGTGRDYILANEHLFN